MAKISKVEPVVQDVLTRVPEARKDNYILYNEVLKAFISTDISFASICIEHAKLGIPALETITRCRRKLQAKYPELQADIETIAIREDEEQEYRNYSRANW